MTPGLQLQFLFIIAHQVVKLVYLLSVAQHRSRVLLGVVGWNWLMMRLGVTQDRLSYVRVVVVDRVKTPNFQISGRVRSVRREDLGTVEFVSGWGAFLFCGAFSRAFLGRRSLLLSSVVVSEILIFAFKLLQIMLQKLDPLVKTMYRLFLQLHVRTMVCLWEIDWVIGSFILVHFLYHCEVQSLLHRGKHVTWFGAILWCMEDLTWFGQRGLEVLVGGGTAWVLWESLWDIVLSLEVLGGLTSLSASIRFASFGGRAAVDTIGARSREGFQLRAVTIVWAQHLRNFMGRLGASADRHDPFSWVIPQNVTYGLLSHLDRVCTTMSDTNDLGLGRRARTDLDTAALRREL